MRPRKLTFSPVWAQHTFTPEEIETLQCGEILQLTNCISKKGKKFSCKVILVDMGNGRGRIVPDFVPEFNNYLPNDNHEFDADKEYPESAKIVSVSKDETGEYTYLKYDSGHKVTMFTEDYNNDQSNISYATLESIVMNYAIEVEDVKRKYGGTF